MSTTAISFEFFPPRTPEAEERLWSVVERLKPLGATFFSVTCGAGGSTREPTLATLRHLAETSGLPAAGHLTCVSAAQDEVDETIRDYWDVGVRHVVALRGDMPELGAPYVPHPGGYASSPDLIEAILAIAPFEISVAAYPERHPESASIDADIEMLKRKVDAGATRAITQFCFESDEFPRLRERMDRAGLDAIPLVPGIMPTTNFTAITRMADRCGATIPAWLADRFHGLEDEPEARKLIAGVVAAQQIEDLRAHGFDTFHLYTLNQGDVAIAICRLLGLGAPGIPEQQVA
jgi:methylenetetrahydrofolate reductase (NADPH)